MAFPSTFLDLQQAVIQNQRLDGTDDLQKAKDWINQAYASAAAQTNFYENSSVSAALTANQSSIAVPAALIIVEFIVPSGSDGSKWSPMDLVSFEEVLENRAWSGGSAAPTGAPYQYAYRSAAAPSIEFWPPASGGETLTFYGAQLPAPLVADGDLPIFPEPHATDVLEAGALVEAAKFKKDLFFLSTYQGMSQEAVAKLRAFTNTRIGDKTQQFKVERQRTYPRGNSVDTGY